MDPTQPIINIRTAYDVLADRVNTALRTQLGDAERLSAARAEALALAEAVDQVIFFFSS